MECSRFGFKCQPTFIVETEKLATMCRDGTSFFFWGNLANLITFSLTIFPYLLIGFTIYQARKNVQAFKSAQQ